MWRLILMYMVGLASVWITVAAVSAATAGFRQFDRDWDRAFERELGGTPIAGPNAAGQR